MGLKFFSWFSSFLWMPGPDKKFRKAKLKSIYASEINMALEERKLKELQISDDLRVSFDLYQLQDLMTVTEVQEGMEQVRMLGQEFRHIHIELYSIMDEDDYDKEYLQKNDMKEQVRKYLRDGKNKVRELEKAEADAQVQRLLEARAAEEEKERKGMEDGQEKSKREIKIEESTFQERLKSELDNFPVTDIGEINHSCEKLDFLLSEYYKLLSRAKIVYGNDFETYPKPKFDDTIAVIRNKIIEGKKKAKEISDKIQQELAFNKAAEEANSKNVYIAEQKCYAETLAKEIELRANSIIKKCDISGLESLSDHQLFEKNKNFYSSDSDIYELFERFTEFHKTASLCGEDKEGILSEPTKIQEIALDTRNTYAQTLHKLMVERDISEEKLRNSTEVSLELSKFQGWDSKLDIFSFKTDFERLIQPTLQKRYWVDSLKTKYLTGSALVLVERCKTIDEIWKTLFEAYGNVKLLLQNKISKLDDVECLEKIKGDEKIGVAVAKVINMMTELSDLASKHNLENKLYIGGGLEKLYIIIGSTRERKFLEKNVDNSFMSSSSGSDEKQEWNALMQYLKKELAVREKLTLVQKSKSSLMGSTEKKSKEKNSVNVTTAGSSLLCHICGETGHVFSRDRAGKKSIDYFSCKKFVSKSPKERRNVLMNKKFCLQCLRPGVAFNKEHFCYEKYKCPDASHNDHEKGLHVLVCEDHKATDENKNLLEEYKKNIIGKKSNKFEDFTKNIALVCHVEIDNRAFQSNFGKENVKILPDITDSSIFILQTIDIEGHKLNLFFDGGAGGIVIKKRALDILLSLDRAKLEEPGPLPLTGVGGHKSFSAHGAYSIILPLESGYEATLSGICLDQVTAEFPKYRLKNIEKDLKNSVKREFGAKLANSLPDLPEEVGGEVDILIGIKYKRYHPKDIVELLTGLTVYKSVFVSSDGTSGVLGGPHPSFNCKGLNPVNQAYLYSPEVISYRNYCSIREEMPILSSKTFETDDHECVYQIDSVSDHEKSASRDDHGSVSETESVSDFYFAQESDVLKTPTKDPDSHIPLTQLQCCQCSALASQRAPRSTKLYEEIEKAGTSVSYRCPKCRECQECKKSYRIEEISIENEIGQDLIDKCVKVDVEKRETTHVLPFLKDPEMYLKSNDRFALKIYESQVTSLNKKPEDRNTAIEFDLKLHNLGYVEYLDNLPGDERDAIMSSAIKYFIPWRLVFNSNSVTTDSRLVFDASCCPRDAISLNSILAKGTNNMNKLIAILIKWRTHSVAFHTDVRKMYNTILLDKRHWQYHLYYWDNQLRVGIKPRIKVIKTAMYGVRSSGNVAESGIRKIAELTKDEFPKVYNVIKKSFYVDDCLSGDKSVDDANQLADPLTSALETGGFTLKGFIFSGEDPPEHLSKDGKTALVGGIKWTPKEDKISLKIPELNFNKKVRGRKLDSKGKFSDNFTRKNCVSRVHEVFDPIGLLVPITCGFKLDVHELTIRKLEWDDVVPEELRKIWKDNFEMINEIGNVKFHRAVIPSDAVDLEAETIDTADASAKLICVAIYIRYRLKSGGFSCQLTFARSKLVPDGMTQPRAELLAAEMNAATGHVVKTALGDSHKKCLKLTDSQVALFWLGSKRTSLNTWVRNRVIETNRLTNEDDWRWVEGKDMIADLGTRKGTAISDVGPDSFWINGFDWMKEPVSEFPMKSRSDLILDAKAKSEVQKEMTVENIPEILCECDITSINPYVPASLEDRYKFSKYILDPNRHRFRKVVRVLGLMLLFLKNFYKKINRPLPKYFPKGTHTQIPGIVPYFWDQHLVTIGTTSGKFKCNPGLVVILDRDMINVSLSYYFRKATEEIKHFLPKKKYEKISQDIDGILYYTGRILPTQKVTFEGDTGLRLCDTSFDLMKSTFVVPIIDSFSPLAYSIVDEIHWYQFDCAHGGVESVLRQVQCISYVIEGRKLVQVFKTACPRCRYLERNEIKVAMGPVHPSHLCIAPAFNNTQVDICGPFDSFSNANKRARIKIWNVVFCCSTTGATDCKVMEDYSTDSFILAFIRFSCRYGYPSKLYPDSGSQLIKGCNEMVLSFSDIRYKLSTEFGINYEACPVGAHYVHGKIERKIKEVKRSITKSVENRRLSLMQWETLGQQIANSINNLPIGLGNKVASLENVDLITPNRLLLGRNNNRAPTKPLILSTDAKKIIQTNEDIFTAWFQSWLVSYVPTLVPQPKWFKTDRDIAVGDIVLFSKSDKEFENLYQYGIVKVLYTGKDGLIRTVGVEYQNASEDTKRSTKRGVREIVVIHQVDEVSISKELFDLAHN